MIFGSNEYKNRNSTVSGQNFSWVAEYYDGTHLIESSMQESDVNKFYLIDRDKLIKFGLIGMGSQMYFNISNGVFNINNNKIQVSYVVNNEEYPLTGRMLLYNDIIQKKVGFVDVSMGGVMSGSSKSNIASQFVGYKKSMFLVDANINFKNILHIPQDRNLSPYLEIKISSDKDMNGQLVIKVNGMIANKLDAPLLAGKAGVHNWKLI